MWRAHGEVERLFFFILFVVLFVIFYFSFIRLCFVFCCTGRWCSAGSMATQGADALGFLTRRHGVKVESVVSVEDCILAIGEVVGHKNVLAASRMSNAVVCFVNTVENAVNVVERGIVIRGVFTSVLPLSTPTKKVILSNVPPFVKDDVLIKELSRFGKVVAPVKKIAIGGKSDLVKHVVSFRRFTYMILSDNKTELNLTLKLKIQDFDYTVYVSTDVMKCFGCGRIGHLVRTCPENTNAKQVANKNAMQDNDQTAHVVESLPTGVAQVVKCTTNKVPVVHTEEIPTTAENILVSDKIGSNVSSVTMVTDELLNVTKTAECVNDVQTDDVNLGKVDMDQNVFKVPLKRRIDEKQKKGKEEGVKQARKEIDDLESESDFSDSNTSECSQSEWRCNDYSVDGIKKFLALTKNQKRVQVAKYFSDLRLFVDKTKILMSEGCFIDKEVYRLRKFVTKIQNQLSNDDEMA